MRKFLIPFLIATLSSVLPGCHRHAVKYVDTRATAVALPEQLTDQSLKDIQAKHYDTLVAVAKTSPFSMIASSIGFVRQKDNVYLAINLIGETYNDIKTSTGTRLSNEFHAKYKTTASLFLSKGFEQDSLGFRVLLGVAHYNFVTQEAWRASPENIELFTPWPVVSGFVSGDISGQELVSQSLVFVNGQRTDFTLQFL